MSRFAEDCYVIGCVRGKHIGAHMRWDGQIIIEPMTPAPNPEEVIKRTTSLIDKDSVEHPTYYTSHPSGIECIEIAQHHNFNVGSALKYLWRQGLKDGEPSIKDLKKAIVYINFEIERQEKANG